MAINMMAERGLDERLRLLAHEDRRAVLQELADADPDEGTPITVDASGPLDLEASTVELHHQHLPMLAEHDLVVWHPESHTVVRGPQFHEIVPLLYHLAAFDHAP